MRFLLDEHLSPAIAKGLVRRSIDVATLTTAGLLGEDDEQIPDFAIRENRIIVTQDDDFLVLARRASHGGMVYSSQQSHSIGEYVRFLHLMSECMTADEMLNRIEFF